MRIIAGEAKNRPIKCRKGYDTRPTLENIREALFSKIAEHIPGCKFLDLFSGSGAIALEALSRGARYAILIESETDALKVIIENINYLGFEDRCRAYKNSVTSAISVLGNKNEKFDVIFMDPPYDLQCCKKVLKSIEKKDILAEGGIIICEHDIDEKLEEKIGKFAKYDEKIYRKKVLSFYEMREVNNE